ncbi:uncharacterized protein LOC126905069 [Daktulosphaira vitifoliae]|uniref:uncharacterized protein LOC126905069 n=1 Tax=Daktulosphaira vitifoliae TaxID=58002 RepID=UPI0021AAB039|nr:uncharacterized protein LOC126905069 [Daktulosphaira vitifoliae]
MTSKFSLFCFLLISSVHSIISSEIYLDCYYSKYILYNLNTKVIYFNKIISADKPDILIKKFAKGLQTLGPIVKAMAEKIKSISKIIISWSTSPFKNLNGLLYTNFYLNNLSNTLLLQTYQNVTVQTRELSDREIFINEFKKIYPILFEQLIQNILDACYKGKQMNFPDIVIQNQFVDQNYNDNVFINDMLPPNNETIETLFDKSNIELTMSKVNDTEVDLRYYFQIKIENKELNKTVYHPKSMLFSNLFDLSKRSKFSEIIEVPINEKLENGNYPNMEVLFDMIKHTFDVDCVESFQRQIVAATVYPYYICVAKFAHLLNKIIFGNYIDESKIITRVMIYKDNLINAGKDLNKTINNLIKIKYLPKSVEFHLSATNDLLRGIVGIIESQQIDELDSGFIDQLYLRCAGSMEFNLIHFDTGVKNTNIYDHTECEKIIAQLENKIKNIETLTNNLNNEASTYSYFSKGLQVFSFHNTFSEKLKCNIVQKNKQGYLIMGK